MPNIFNRYATPLTTGLFLVSLISGVALFFHFGSAWFHGMHEWLSMVLIAPVALHLWKNWRSLMNYVGRPPFAIAMAASVLAALVFVYPAATGGSGGPPQLALVRTILANTPAEVAPLLDATAENLVARLKGAGFAAAAADAPLADIASKSGKSDADLVSALLPPQS